MYDTIEPLNPLKGTFKKLTQYFIDDMSQQELNKDSEHGLPLPLSDTGRRGNEVRSGKRTKWSLPVQVPVMQNSLL